MSASIKKWIGIISSFWISAYVMYIISMPIILVTTFVGRYYWNNQKYFVAESIWIISCLIPFLVTIFLVFKMLHKDILNLVSENLDESGTPILLDAKENQEDEINKKIVNAFNKAKDKLKINKEIKLIRMVNSSYVNAFAIGNTKGEAAIVVFDELAKHADEEMMQSIIGHELGHIKNKDSITSVILYSNQYALPILENISDRISYFTLNITKEIPFVNFGAVMLLYLYKFITLITVVPGFWITHAINLFISRESEHLADKAGVKASSKETMLKTLKFLSSIEGETPKKGSLLEFLASTHPSTNKRIKYINKI